MNSEIQGAWNQAQQHVLEGYALARRQITIDPITRLEGHGRIEVFLDDRGEVERAYLQVPELRGFEVFSVGRPAEDMPQITSRICGVCPTAHHLAATKALDDLYGIEPPPAARRIRELIYHAFIFEDHALHVYLLGGPDFLVGPDAPAAQRNVVGMLGKLGPEVVKRVLATRRRVRELIAYFGGKAIHPVFGLPGGVSKPLAPEHLPELQAIAAEALDFAGFTLGVFHDLILGQPRYFEQITSDTYTHRTFYLGLVDAQGHVAFDDGSVRIVDADGREFATFAARQYRDFIAEHVEPWSRMKFCFLKPLGWHGFAEGAESGIYAVGPLARLNTAAGMATPRAQRAYEDFFARFGTKPVHHTLANHWARVIEMLYAAERMGELVGDPDLLSPDIRRLPTAGPTHGVGVVEAPRGTLFHDYETDPRGLITRANLIVATQNNAARIALSVEKAAAGLIHGGNVSDGLLNRIEMAFRAYDPCLGCATHALPGQVPLVVEIRDRAGRVIRQLEQA